MSGLGSTAVMNQRHSANADALDFFPTPPWATRALIEVLWRYFGRTGLGTVALDPCCGAGHMAIPLAEHFPRVIATDVQDRGFGERRDLDFLMSSPEDFGAELDWIICNPPFVLAERFFHHARRLRPHRGIATLARLNWLEGGERHAGIFGGPNRPAFVCPFAERVPMIEGVWDPEASSATAYAWFVWYPGPRKSLTMIEHIPPGSASRHSRPEDEALATRGEAARRAAARRADVAMPPQLFGGA